MKRFSRKKLIKFLRTAKINAYASSSKPIYMSDGKKTYTFKEGDFWYKDTYYANLIDAGQEVVWYKNIPVWVMSYHGGLQDNPISSKVCFEFLKKALKKIPIEFPIRGPKHFRDQHLEYFNNFKGDIINFVGNEQIEKNNKKVYSKNYLGGLVLHKDIVFLKEISIQKISID